MQVVMTSGEIEPVGVLRRLGKPSVGVFREGSSSGAGARLRPALSAPEADSPPTSVSLINRGSRSVDEQPQQEQQQQQQKQQQRGQQLVDESAGMIPREEEEEEGEGFAVEEGRDVEDDDTEADEDWDEDDKEELEGEEERPEMLFGRPGDPSLVAKDAWSITVQWTVCDALREAVGRDCEVSYVVEIQQVDVAPARSTPEMDAGMLSLKSEAWKAVYRGPEPWTQIRSLRPGRYYAVRVLGIPYYDGLASRQGAYNCSSVVVLQTAPNSPGAPQPPCLAHRDRTSLKFKWSYPKDCGGLDILDFKLQIQPAPLNMQGSEDEEGFTEVYCGSMQDFTIEQLQPGVKYKARVKAINEVGEGPWSLHSAFKSQSSPPSTPRGLHGSAVSPTCVLLQWTPACDNGSRVESYTIEIEETLTCNKRTCNSSTNRFDVKGLKGGTSYKFSVRAQNQIGQGNWSQQVEVKTLSSVPGQPPTPAVASATKTSAAFSWKSPPDTGGSEVNKYEAELLCAYGGAITEAGAKWKEVYSGAATSCTTNDLIPGTSYEFRVRACNEAGSGPWSQNVNVKTTPGLPDKPSPPSVVSKSSLSLGVQWKPPGHDGGTAISEYQLEFCQCCKSPREGVDPFEIAYRGKLCETEVMNLSPGTEYVFRVSATNSFGTSEWSAVGSGTTRAGVPMPPIPPVLFQSNSNSLTVCWSAPECQGSAIVSYTAEMAVRSSCSETSASESDEVEDIFTSRGNRNGEYSGLDFREVYRGSSTSCSIPNLLASTEYVFRIRATNRVGNSWWSDSAIFMTEAAAPSSPRELQIEDASSDSISLCWLPPKSENGAKVNTYIVEGCPSRSKKPSWETKYRGLSTHCRVAHLRCGSEYLFRVRAGNVCGLGPFSDPIPARSAAAAPEAPEPPIFSHKTATSVRVKWSTPKENGAPLELYRLDMALEGGAFIEVFSGLATSYKVVGLLPGHHYHVRVQGVNEAGAGEWSDTSSFDTALSPPPIPTNVAVSARLDDEAEGRIQDAAALEISWESPSIAENCAEVASYEVEASSNNDRPRSSIVRNVQGCKCTLDLLPIATSFLVRIRSVGENSAGHSNWSEPVTVTTPGWRKRPSTPSESNSSGNLATSMSVGSRSSKSQTSDACEDIPQSAKSPCKSGGRSGYSIPKRRPRPKKPLLKALKPYYGILGVILLVLVFCLMLWFTSLSQGRR